MPHRVVTALGDAEEQLETHSSMGPRDAGTRSLWLAPEQRHGGGLFGVHSCHVLAFRLWLDSFTMRTVIGEF
jgi:hypothetical protein